MHLGDGWIRARLESGLAVARVHRPGGLVLAFQVLQRAAGQQLFDAGELVNCQVAVGHVNLYLRSRRAAKGLR